MNRIITALIIGAGIGTVIHLATKKNTVQKDSYGEGGNKKMNSKGTSFIGRKDLSKGLRNNNPLNLHVSKRAYKGKVQKPLNPDFDSDGKQLEQFETFEYGLKAAIEHLGRYYNGQITTLQCYKKSDGKLDTIQKILNRWVCGLNPTAYVTFVERETGYNRDAVLNLNDKNIMSRLVYAMALNECGTKYRSDILSAGNFQKYIAGAFKL